MSISWLFLAAALWGAWFTWNAYRPIHRPAGLATLSFFAGWLTSELALHHILWQLVLTALFIWAGALAAWPGWLALGHDNRVTLFRVDDWHAVRLENAQEPAWSRDGRHLAVVSENGVDVMNPDGTGRVTVSSEIGYPPVTWMP